MKSKRKTMRERLMDRGISIKGNFVYLICKTCQKESKVQTSDKELYTKEVRENYTCLVCSIKEKKRKK